MSSRCPTESLQVSLRRFKWSCCTFKTFFMRFQLPSRGFPQSLGVFSPLAVLLWLTKEVAKNFLRHLSGISKDFGAISPGRRVLRMV